MSGSVDRFGNVADGCKKFVAYYRVSTVKQGDTGLGLDAQRGMVNSYIERVGGVLVSDYAEVISGGEYYRPSLEEALACVKRVGGVLLVAKLDRLSRSLKLLERIRDEGINFVCVDMPDANNLTINLLMCIAQNERELVSVRTKAAMAVLKSRGVRFGFANPKIKRGYDAYVRRRRFEDQRFRLSSDNYAVMASYKYVDKHKALFFSLADSDRSRKEVVAYLNEHKVELPDVRSKRWTYCNLRRVLNRLYNLDNYKRGLVRRRIYMESKMESRGVGNLVSGGKS